MERRKLFSNNAPVNNRRKLFSAPEPESIILKTVICPDCGYCMETAAKTTNLICPKCGGTRFNVIPAGETVEEAVGELREEGKTFSRRSLFNQENERAFSEENESPLVESLRIYSGKEVSDDQIPRKFAGETSESLLEKGFADVCSNNSIRIFENAHINAKLFSKLIITITKELDLPDQSDCSRESIISDLADRGSLGPKGIMIIKKAHSMLPTGLPEEALFSETAEWMKDSGILNDLPNEFGGESMSLDQFNEILEQQYDDAPEGIMQALEKSGLINIQGSEVHILK